MFSKHFKKKRGFTLVELIIVIAIALFVIVAIYSVLRFGNTVLNNSNDQYDIQNDIRIASGYLSREVRFATELEIIQLSDVKAEDGYDYFYIDGGALHHAKYESPSSFQETSFGDFISNDVSKSYFSESADDILNITIMAVEDNKEYVFSTDTVLENFKYMEPNETIEGAGQQLAIKFKAKDSIEEIGFIPVSSITITTDGAEIIAPVQISGTPWEIDLDALVGPEDASIKTVVWSVAYSDTSIATVNSAGKVTAKTNGTANITASAVDGSGASDTVTVEFSNMVPPVQYINITYDKVKVGAVIEYETRQFENGDIYVYPTISWPGHTFKGWYLNKNNDVGGRIDTLPDQTVPTSDLTLYAHW